MKLTVRIPSVFAAFILILLTTRGLAAVVDDAFTYQGSLSVTGLPANGNYEMKFDLYRTGDVSPHLSVTALVAVARSLFTVRLDYGPGVFDGTAYELGIAVREQGSAVPFVPLMPHQPLTATPNALHAETARSVPDSALSSNVALLNGSPVFTTPVKATTLRVANSAGGGVLSFGNNPDNICAIAVDPQGPTGLLLRDPSGIRILVPTGSLGQPTLRFGPTDDCSIGIDPAFPGLIERDPIGFRLLGQNNQGCRLIFGPTMNCTVEVDPAGPAGLLLRDPSGIRVLSPDPQRPPTLRFGPTDDCSIGIDPVLSGLRLRDPGGLRIAPSNAPPTLRFGPTDDCSIGIDPALSGLILRDPNGLRIFPNNPAALPTLRFGPTDDCSIGIDPAFPGLVIRDPSGIRLFPNSPNAQPSLRFGPTDDCTIGIDPVVTGLLLRDPRGIRVLSPDPQRPPTLRFGPTDDCSIGIDPAFPGLIVRDPSGLRVAPPGSNTPSRLIFGPTDLCTIGIEPALAGLVIRDPSGLRITPAVSNAKPRLLFGPTDDCSIEVQTGSNVLSGLLLRDPKGIRVLNPMLSGTNTILFGSNDVSRVTVDPSGGMRFSNPQGFTFGSQVAVNGPVFAQAFVQTSSRRFKNDVKPIEKPLEKLAKLEGVRFTWNEEKGGKKDVGFIAEEVAKVIPEVVSWEEDGKNARGVNYDHLVAVTVEGIKAQQSQIETLQREKAELKQSLATMQAQLDRLTQQMQSLLER